MAPEYIAKLSSEFELLHKPAVPVAVVFGWALVAILETFFSHRITPCGWTQINFALRSPSAYNPRDGRRVILAWLTWLLCPYGLGTTALRQISLGG